MKIYINLNKSNNSSNNFNENPAENNGGNENLDLRSSSDTHAEPEEAINALELHAYYENIHEIINTSEQISNLSSHIRPIHNHRSIENAEILFSMLMFGQRMCMKVFQQAKGKEKCYFSVKGTIKESN